MNELHYITRAATDDDEEAVLSIFNYYVENSFAAYPESKVDKAFFRELKIMTVNHPFYVVEQANKAVIGFGLLHNYSRERCFNKTALITYFIAPGFTRRGIGSDLLGVLTKDASKMGLKTLLANISSKNKTSINFHQKNGFKECGRFINIGHRFNEDFDQVWMQKFI